MGLGKLITPAIHPFIHVTNTSQGNLILYYINTVALIEDGRGKTEAQSLNGARE